MENDKETTTRSSLEQFVSKREEAWQRYEQTFRLHGENDNFTQECYLLFCLRCNLVAIREHVEGNDELIADVERLSEEVDALSESRSTIIDQCEAGLEKYPKFLRSFIRRRRLKAAFVKRTKGIRARISAFEKKLPEGDREERQAKIRQELKGPRGKNHD